MSGPPAEPSRLPALGPRGEGWVYLQVALILAVAVAGAAATVTVPEGFRLPVQVAGIGLTSLGVVLVYRASLALGRSLQPWPTPKETATLVNRGVYGRVRHPIYAGLMLATIGWSIFEASPLALVFALALLVVLDLKARREEAWLRARYPEYASYASRTHKFIPGIY